MRLPRRLEKWLPLVQQSAAKHGVDPLLILAIMDRESRGGDALRPAGPSGTGDDGHGRGLMQIDDRWHPEFVAKKSVSGTFLWQDPAANIDYATALIAQNLKTFEGDVRLAISAYNCGARNVQKAVRECGGDSQTRYAAADAKTTGGDYSRDIMRRMGSYIDPPPLPSKGRA